MSSFKPNYFQRRSKPQGPKANERIRALDVQVIGSDGGNLGTLPLNKAIEIISVRINKGVAISELFKNNYDFIICMGDDISDEYMFNNLPKDWLRPSAPTS